MLPKHWQTHNPPRDYFKRRLGRPGNLVEHGYQLVPNSVQSFSWDHDGSRRLLPVPSGPDIKPQQKARLDAGSLIEKDSIEMFGSATSSKKLGSESMLPFFVNSGAAAFIAPYDPKDLERLVLTPRKTEPELLKLRRVQVKRCISRCKDIRQGNPVIRRLLRTSLPCVCCLSYQI